MRDIGVVYENICSAVCDLSRMMRFRAGSVISEDRTRLHPDVWFIFALLYTGPAVKDVTRLAWVAVQKYLPGHRSEFSAIAKARKMRTFFRPGFLYLPDDRNV